jgi:exodeoxyribonuclease VII large subunit
LRLERGSHRLALLRQRLEQAQSLALDARRQSLAQRLRALEAQHPRLRLAGIGHRADLLRQRLLGNASNTLQQRQLQLAGVARALHSLSPFATLSRGYAILRDPLSGAVIRSASQAQPGQALEARLASGELSVQVTGSRESSD